MSDIPEPETSLVEHLIELRDRLLRCLLIIALLFGALFPFANRIYDYVSEPLRVYLPEGSSMIATDVAAPFLAPFKLTFFVALLAAVPFVLYQVWAFVAPGLYRRERHIVLPLFASSVALFYGGMAFAYYLVFPLIFGFFTSAGPEHVAVMTDISRYLDFVLKLFFAFGFSFEIPVAIVILSLTGTVDPLQLAAKRPYVIVGCFTVGMLLTPPDVFSQTLLAVPMWLLFELGILFGKLVYRREPPPEEAPATGDR
ncbi:MAG: twin-arginine translocase subunit TatC [Pseudomonadota bacterium]|jgi:sec-independent protein translocase protein TatC